MYTNILEKAKELIGAIDDNYLGELWDSDLEEAHPSVHYYGIKDQLDELKTVIKSTEKCIYDADARNHPVWKESQINPYNNRGGSTFEHLDCDLDLDAGWEDWKVYWESEEVFLYVRIGWTHDDGRDWSDVELKNWKSEKDTVKWLRDRDVDENNELSNDYIIDEAHGLHEIIQFNGGYLINREKVEENRPND